MRQPITRTRQPRAVQYNNTHRSPERAPSLVRCHSGRAILCREPDLIVAEAICVERPGWVGVENTSESNDGRDQADCNSFPRRCELTGVSDRARYRDYFVARPLHTTTCAPPDCRRSKDLVTATGAVMFSVLSGGYSDRSGTASGTDIAVLHSLSRRVFSVAPEIASSIDLIGASNFLWLRSAMSRERGIAAYGRGCRWSGSDQDSLAGRGSRRPLRMLFKG